MTYILKPITHDNVHVAAQFHASGIPASQRMPPCWPTAQIDAEATGDACGLGFTGWWQPTAAIGAH